MVENKKGRERKKEKENLRNRIIFDFLFKSFIKSGLVGFLPEHPHRREGEKENNKANNGAKHTKRKKTK